MNKLIYTAPELELLEMEVEQGFMLSDGTDTNLQDLGYDSHSAMD